MATIRAYTTVEQSRKLAEFLPIESADMHYVMIDTENEIYSAGLSNYMGILPSLPCWSLTALLDILPDRTCVYKKTCKDGRVKYKGVVKGCKELILKENPIDACVKMILKLNKLNLL